MSLRVAMRSLSCWALFAAVVLRAHGAFAQSEEPPAPVAPAPEAPSLPSADASESAEYKQAVEGALKEYELGHFEEARSLFERAHRVAANARTLRGLGQVEFELRHYVRAMELLEQSLASEKKPLTPEQRTTVESLLARARLFIATYEVRVMPPRNDIVVELDGNAVALGASTRLALEAGDHTLRISGSGLAARELRLDVKGGERQTLHITLVVKSSRADPHARASADERRPASVTRPFRKLGIGLMAASGALLLSGGVLGGLALDKAHDVERRHDPSDDAARTLALASDISLGVGLTSAAVGLVLMVWKRKVTSDVELGHTTVSLSQLRLRF